MIKKLILSAALCIAALSAEAQILNPSFENWDYNPVSNFWRLQDWQHCYCFGEVNNNELLFGTYRDSLPQDGQFALKISRWYAYDCDIARFNGPINYRPAALNGYYKYTDPVLTNGQTDTAQAAVYLTRYNPATQSTDTVGQGILELTATDVFIPFSCVVNYIPGAEAPDSIRIEFQPSRLMTGMSGCLSGSWCSYLSVDNLSLSGTTSTGNVPQPNAIRIFPNPVTQLLNVQGVQEGQPLSIINSYGQVISRSIAAGDNVSIETGHLAPGVYFLSAGPSLTRFVVVRF